MKARTSTLLWAGWVLAFAVLEWLGLRSGKDTTFTLTNRVRALMRAHPWLRYVLHLGIAIGLGWLWHHFLIVDPEKNRGA